ncbi:hypothetical protein OEZ85_005479 [Tetradesmus obliquus]|uniref:UmuC domain-containing protein n=1 Tax=Tetradesmus obliquus TaxID=3088 RepID=A0ABY8UI33_TETOB|nr:hypothetical protein OEZ85_005479 [Tetradesmus obliquus]
MHPYGSPTHCVLHVDVDSFFCQVEELRCPSLAGRPLAIQQHQDVIAVNYPGRAAGVKKHMPPAQARVLLSAAGGLLVHVFTEPDGRVSYRPYREASAALMRLLSSGLPPAAASCVAVVEKASIDEAYLLVAGGQGAGQQFAAQGLGGSTGVALPDMPAWLAANAAATWDCSLGADMAAAVRAAAKAQLGLTVSVGVAPNKLLAKLASRAAKPDGVHVVGGVAAVQALLAATPVDKLPGLGGVAPALQRLGITTAQQLQGHSATSLASLLGGQQQARLAGRLAEAGWGRDEARVVDKGPAKSLQVQMTLTPQMRPLPPNLQAAGRGPIAGQASNAAGGGMLVPLLTGAADTAPRLAAVLGAMAGDLLGRVMLDRHVEDRWPRKLALTLTTSGNPPRSATRSTTFPTPALAAAAAAAAPAPAAAATNSPAKVAAGINGGGVSGAGAKGAAQAPAAPAAAFDAPGVVGEKRYAAGSALHAAVVNLAAGLAQVLVAPLPAGHPVTILNLTASNFGPYEAAAASGSIRRFTTAAAGPPPAAVAAALAALLVAAGGLGRLMPQQREGPL